MVLTRAQRKRLQKMVDEGTDSSLVENLHPIFEYVAPARPKKARRTAILPNLAQLPSQNGADDHNQLEVCPTPISTVSASPAKPVNFGGAVDVLGGIGAVMSRDFVTPAIGNFEFTHTMTYNTCSNLAATNDVIATGDDARPSDLSKCTCYFRCLRSFIDLPPHFGYDANDNRAGGIWSMAPKLMTWTVAATSCLLMGVYCWQHGVPGVGKALVSSTVEAHPAPHSTLWTKFRAKFYGYLVYAFYN